MLVHNRNFEHGVRLCWWILLVVVIGLILFIRIRLLAIPLERDEGEYAYAGQLMLQGIPPYQLAYNMKFPGIYAAYALIMSMFGQTSVVIHLGLLIVNMASMLVIFLIGRQLINFTAGIAAAASYAVLSVSSAVMGLAAHASHFAMLPALLGALVLLKPVLSKKMVFVSGTLLGVSLLMKQPAIFFICFGATYLLFRDWRSKVGFSEILLRSALFIAATALPLACVCLRLWHAGVFAKFWSWTVLYAQEYARLVPISGAPGIFFEQFRHVIRFGWPLWMLAALGIFASLFDKTIRNAAVFILAFLVFSGLALSSGFYFREHYFIFFLPAICFLVGAIMASTSNFCSQLARSVRLLPLGILGAAMSFAVFAEREILLFQSPYVASHSIYGGSPFPEAIRVAQYLREQTNPSDTIAVLGSEPEIYFYAHRHSATGYIYMYGLMEPQRFAGQMQRQMIREIEAARPKYLVLVGVRTSWLRRPNSEAEIFKWIHRYTAKDFRLDGLVNIVSRERTDYYLPLSVDPKTIHLSRYSLLIFERKT
jgi:hypothetical protein